MLSSLSAVREREKEREEKHELRALIVRVWFTLKMMSRTDFGNGITRE